MNKILTACLRVLPAALVLASAVSLTSVAHAEDRKTQLATQLVKLQLKPDGQGNGVIDAITNDALGPTVSHWMQEVQVRVPQSKQQAINDQLNKELKSFSENTHKAIQAEAEKTAVSTLVPIYTSKLSEEELNTLVNFFQSSASEKYAKLVPDAYQSWAKAIMTSALVNQVKGYTKTFDDAANRIVGSAAQDNPAAAPAK